MEKVQDIEAKLLELDMSAKEFHLKLLDAKVGAFEMMAPLILP